MSLVDKLIYSMNKVTMPPVEPEEYMVSHMILNMKNLCTKELESLIINSNIDDIVKYKGNDDYENLPELDKLKECYLRDNRSHMNFCYYLEQLKVFLENGYDKCRNDWINDNIQRDIYDKNQRNKSISKTKDLINNMKNIIDLYDKNGAPGEGDFSFCVFDRDMTKDHWTAMNELNLQNYFKKDRKSFMFHGGPESLIFLNHPLVEAKYGHSGASVAFMCRKMQSIAQLGWKGYVDSTIQSYRDIIKELYSKDIPIDYATYANVYSWNSFLQTV